MCVLCNSIPVTRIHRRIDRRVTRTSRATRIARDELMSRVSVSRAAPRAFELDETVDENDTHW